MHFADLRFLVVEDHPFQRWLSCNLLHEMGARWVFPAGDGNSALDILALPGPPIDIVLSDLDMPGMDGMALIRNMAERSRAPSLIVVSGADRGIIGTVEAMAREYGIKVLGAVEKPLTARKLKGLISAARDVSAEPNARSIHFTADEIASGMRSGQFETYFQPKVEIRTGELRGAEALARWIHPAKGLVPPAHFIEAAETAGLIDELTWSLVREAAGCCAAWHRAGAELTVSVNLSPHSLPDIGLADRMVGLAAEARIEPRHLILEVTESAATADVGRELENLSRLRMRGFGLSIDDYGTGYSSMQRLARVPFTELKIDRAFVKRALAQEASRAMVESSLELAQKLGINAVAEGVETREEWEMLLGLGCSLAQGYLIAPPMNAAEFSDWIQLRQRGTA
ncbi:MAG TPA: EAL domain-containing response regulator [Usitatibacter sp.]|nr:EAL domain-containing response regulator [Usitatibacter sp.]